MPIVAETEDKSPTNILSAVTASAEIWPSTIASVPIRLLLLLLVIWSTVPRAPNVATPFETMLVPLEFLMSVPPAVGVAVIPFALSGKNALVFPVKSIDLIQNLCLETDTLILFLG